MARSGIPVYADTAALSRLSKSLRQASPAAWKAYKIAVRTAAEAVLRDMQARASYSSRIPQSGRVVVTAAGNVKIVFDAPDAAPIENSGKGFVRHPVHGHMDRWTAKNSHPAFASPALAAHQEEVLLAVEAAVTEAVRRVLGGV
jgi:hypothetical protein